MNYSNIAKRVITEESLALVKLSKKIPSDFKKVIDYILNLKGRVILIGIGKSGYIAKKIASSLASTGTPAFYIHPSEASHGDLGMITNSDLVIILSNSGETKEIFDTINYCKRYNIKLVGMTMKKTSTLAKNCNFLLGVPENKEASLISAPTTSALMMLALGDAIVTALHEAKGFSKDAFSIFHPGGKIGSNLLKISDLMYKKDKLPLVNINDSFADVIITITSKSLGCAVVIDKTKTILGIITDGDLRRHIHGDLNSMTALDIMTKSPISIEEDKLATEALYIMNNKSITVLPVGKNNKIVGIIHIHDILRAGVG